MVSARSACFSSTAIKSLILALSASSASKNGLDGAIWSIDSRTISWGKASLKSLAARSTGATIFAHSAPSLAWERPSASVSRHSSNTCEVDTVSPKNKVAVSGSWCASSKMTVLAEGSNSAIPVSFNATSAKKRWWLTTTTSACCASFRAFMTKQSW